MSELDAEELRILRAARRGLSPDAAAAKQVLEATLGALHGSGTHGSVPNSEPGNPRMLHESAALGFASWRRAATVLASVAALCGGAGYFVGHREGRRSLEDPASRVAVVAAPAASFGPGTRALAPRAPVESDSPPLARSERSETTMKSAEARRAPPSPVPSSAAHGEPSSALEEELRTLRRVERSLRDGNPRFALALLRELDTAVPRGQMMQERQAAATIAKCRLGASDAPALATAFIEGHERSVYVKRVREACGVGEGTGAPAAPATDPE